MKYIDVKMLLQKSKTKRLPKEIYDDDAISFLLDFYMDKYINKKCGSLILVDRNRIFLVPFISSYYSITWVIFIFFNY